MLISISAGTCLAEGKHSNHLSKPHRIHSRTSERGDTYTICGTNFNNLKVIYLRMLTSGGIWSTGKWFWKAPAHKTWTSKPILTFLDLIYTGSVPLGNDSGWKSPIHETRTSKPILTILDLGYTGSVPLGYDSGSLIYMKPGHQNQFWHFQT
jgi:hypothetical protein